MRNMAQIKQIKKWKKAIIILEALLLMLVLQAVRECLEHLVAGKVPAYTFAERMVTMTVMLLLTVLLVLYAKIKKVPLSIFPEHFSKGYIIFTCIAVVLLVSTPSNFTDGFQAIMLLFYGSIVTPVYEELIFRGYLWNRLNTVISKEIYTFLWSVMLFTVWHLGYMVQQLLSGNWVAVLWKLAAGLGYGIILGIVRIKTKNCYSTMLVHGVLNNFMI